MDTYSMVILPLMIFFARIVDVSLGTLRIIFVSRGWRKVAPLLGFVEVFIWIVVVGQLVQNLNSFISYVAYASGFAAGNFVGMFIEQRLAFGSVIIRVIVQNCGNELMEKLHNAGCGVTGIDATGSIGPVKVIYIIIKRKHLPAVRNIINSVCPKAFMTIEDVRSTQEGIFPAIDPGQAAQLPDVVRK